MVVSEFMKAMIDYSEGNTDDINHFMKVYTYAKTIGELEHLDVNTQLTLELAAVVHDIACPLCRVKYGNTNGKHQEEESAGILSTFLPQFHLDPVMEQRIVFLVSHHHTYTGVDGLDYRILLEADYLVNAEEKGYSKENILSAESVVFETASGKAILKSVFQL